MTAKKTTATSPQRNDEDVDENPLFAAADSMTDFDLDDDEDEDDLDEAAESTTAADPAALSLPLPPEFVV